MNLDQRPKDGKISKLQSNDLIHNFRMKLNGVHLDKLLKLVLLRPYLELILLELILSEVTLTCF